MDADIKHIALRCEEEYFDAIKAGVKTFEVRRNDRNFHVGDMLELVRSKNGSFGKSDNVLSARVTYILHDDFRGLAPGYCVMSIEVMS